MSCYVIGAGKFYGFQESPKETDFVIAADGGYAVCLREGITPSCVLGDFDSLGHIPNVGNLVQVPVEKDDTDTMLAVKLGLENGHTEFHIYGGVGGRLDHTIANLQTLLYLKRHSGRGWLYDENAVYTVIENEELILPAKAGGILSVFAMDGSADGVCIEGAKYPLKNGTLNEDFPLGVSNHFVGECVRISCKSGALLVCISNSE